MFAISPVTRSESIVELSLNLAETVPLVIDQSRKTSICSSVCELANLRMGKKRYELGLRWNPPTS